MNEGWNRTVTPVLVNAEQMARHHPLTFHRPNTDKIKVGDVVKVCDDQERFWVQVTERWCNILHGRIDNELIGGQIYNYGDIIEFCTANVYEIFDGPGFPRRESRGSP